MVVQTSEPAPRWSLENDLAFIAGACAPIWPKLKGARIFLTGGTGFIGCWLLEALRDADTRFGLGLHVSVLTRDPGAFRRKAPHLALYKGFDFIAGNIVVFEKINGAFSHVIHAATDASADLNENDPLRMFSTIVDGTRCVLDFAVEKKVEHALFLSSGAVYGQQPWEVSHVVESYIGAPDCTQPRNAYAEAKRAAEMLCGIYGKQLGLRISIARIFALLGPHLPLDIHFAAGNFIRDAMQGKPVIVLGNGRPCRSFLYASDLTVWLLHLLILGTPGKAYNVGSNESVSIAELAERTAQIIGFGKYEIRGKTDDGWNTGRYVPNTDLVAQEFGLYRTVSLEEAIRRTALWHGWKGPR